jgi:hypothetical protein
MYDLLTHTISQGLQAFLPVAFALPWFRRTGDADASAGVKWGLLVALPATAAAALGFQSSTRQALWEAALAVVACALAIWFERRVRRGARSSPGRLAFAVATTMLVTRQTMEIAIVFAAALHMRALDPLIALASGVALSAVAVVIWLTLARRLSARALHTGTISFAVLFVAQAALYAFHESAEARLLPWSEVLHAATEPYGPDGAYGRYFSALLLLVPLVAMPLAVLRTRLSRSLGGAKRRRIAVLLPQLAATVAVLAGALAVFTELNGKRSVSYASESASPSGRTAESIAAASHLVFRHTAIDANYSRLSVTPLDARQLADRAAASFICDRVSYAAGRGICLASDRGVFTTYKAVFFDRALKPTRTMPLAGSPSRTRISPDGRLGAITVFVTGQSHGYAGATFSTKTTIVDMESGDDLGDLEQFTTWRNGARFKAADFNFWGVTFGRDSNLFYATLRTSSGSNQATTYLVRGDLALRKMTVLRENVECPSLSPDNRLVAFKKRVGPDPAPWRVYTLDIATLTDRPLALETRSIDDQIEWLDDAQVLYAAPRATESASRDVWVAPIDNSAPPRLFITEAESPIVVR